MDLIEASRNGELEKVRELLKKGVDPNSVGSIDNPHIMAMVNLLDKTTPLIEASKNGHTEVVRLLLGKGADPNKLASFTDNPPIIFACENGHIPVVQLLLERGANPNSTSKHNEPLICVAASHGHLEIVKALVERGVSVESGRHVVLYKTPLMFAIENEHENVVRYLLEKGSNVQHKTIYGDTPLLMAANKENLNIFEMIHMRGADPKIKNRMGFDTLILAVFNLNTDIIEYLLYNNIYNHDDVERVKQLVVRYTTEEPEYRNQIYEVLDKANAKAQTLATTKLLRNKMAHLSHETLEELIGSMKGGRRNTKKRHRKKTNTRKSRR